VITDAEIEAAEQNAAAAEAERAAVEREIAGRPYDPQVGARLAEATWRARHTAAQVTQLREQQAAQHAAQQDRQAAEKAHAKRVTAMTKAMRDSRARVTTAADAAQQALAELDAAAQAHDDLVVLHSGELAAAGLPAYEDLGTVGGARSGLLLGGQWWTRVERGAVLAWVTHRVASARLGHTHRLIPLLAHFTGRAALDSRTDALLAEVSAPEAMEQRTWQRPEMPRSEGAPVLWRSNREREEAEAKLQQEAEYNAQARASTQRFAEALEQERQQRIAAVAEQPPAA
jgi:hypothetical protein